VRFLGIAVTSSSVSTTALRTVRLWANNGMLQHATLRRTTAVAAGTRSALACLALQLAAAHWRRRGTLAPQRENCSRRSTSPRSTKSCSSTRRLRRVWRCICTPNSRPPLWYAARLLPTLPAKHSVGDEVEVPFVRTRVQPQESASGQAIDARMLEP
jgi:hypothetical protein